MSAPTSKSNNISWEDDFRWRLTVTEEALAEFRPYYIGNGHLGVRVGPLALDWNGDRKALLSENGPDFWGRLNPNLLLSLGKFAYDGGEQIILPAWNQVRLAIGGVDYSETEGRHSLSQTLDLRGGEVSLEDRWEYRPGRSARITLRLVVPRSHPLASWYEIALADLADPAALRIGLNTAQSAARFSKTSFVGREKDLLGSYTTRVQGRCIAQGLRWEGNGWTEGNRELQDAHAWVTLTTNAASAQLAVVHSVHGCNESPSPEQSVGKDLASLSPQGRAAAETENRRRWKKLWARALDFRHDNQRWEQLVFVNQFHLLASLDERGRYPLGALGLSRPGWLGGHLWDANLWIFRSALPLWPELARSIVAFNRANLPSAQANAAKNGFHGAYYPWLTDGDGADATPEGYRREIHNGAWVALGAWEASGRGRDRAYLEETTWPILSNVADFFASRAEPDAQNRWHIRDVIPPDESVHEAPHGRGLCDDSVLTNTAAQTVLRGAIEAAQILGKFAAPEWSQVADNLVIQPPGPDGVIPEYEGDTGHQVKQADTILIFYPLEAKAPPELILKNVHAYHARLSPQGGPLMTQQIEALLFMRHGDREQGLNHLFSEYSRYVHGPHLIPYETPNNANSVMLTGIGGMLQALMFGWYGASLDDLRNVPRIGAGWPDE